jgi:hypothetical protein
MNYATTLKMAIFWVVAPCSLVEFDLHFRDAYCLHHQGNDCNNLKDIHFHACHHKNLKSH